MGQNPLSPFITVLFWDQPSINQLRLRVPHQGFDPKPCVKLPRNTEAMEAMDAMAIRPSRSVDPHCRRQVPRKREEGNRRSSSLTAGAWRRLGSHGVPWVSIRCQASKGIVLAPCLDIAIFLLHRYRDEMGWDRMRQTDRDR